jgi:hypothetical protein
MYLVLQCLTGALKFPTKDLNGYLTQSRRVVPNWARSTEASEVNGIASPGVG